VYQLLNQTVGQKKARGEGGNKSFCGESVVLSTVAMSVTNCLTNS
jgi:hypothetical protein